MDQSTRPFDMAAATHSLMQQQQQQQQQQQHHHHHQQQQQQHRQVGQSSHLVPPLSHQYSHTAGMPNPRQQMMPQLVPSPTRPMAHTLSHQHQHQHAQPLQQQHASHMELKQNFYNPYHVKHRRRTTKDQLALLEGTFKNTPKPSSEVRKALATALHMSAREVQIWFQNRRAKQKNMLLRAGNSASAQSATNTPSNAVESSTSSPIMSPVDATAVSTSSLVSAMFPSVSGEVATQPVFARASSAEQLVASHQAPQLTSTKTAPAIAVSTSAPSSSASVFGPNDGASLPSHALRRHSDIPGPYARPGQPAATAATAMATPPASTASAATTARASLSGAIVAATNNGPPIEEQPMPASTVDVTALMTAAAATSSSAVTECTPPPMMAFAAAMAAAAASSSMPPLSPQGITQQQQQHPPPPPYSNAYGMASPPRSALQMPMQLSKKQKKAANGSSDNYHIARVHHEAFDGTNKLPLKPDDLSPRSADDQYHILDPANLPSFMLPGASATSPINGGGSDSSNMYGVGLGGSASAVGSLVSGPFGNQQLQPNSGIPVGSNPGLHLDFPYGASQQQGPLQHQNQQQGVFSTHPAPQTDMALLFSGLFVPNSGMYVPGLSASAAPNGMLPLDDGNGNSNSNGGSAADAASAHGVESAGSILNTPTTALGMDAASIYQALFSLVHQNPGTMPQQHQPQEQQQQHRDPMAARNSYNSHEMSPESSAAESVALASPALPYSSISQPPPLVHAGIGGKPHQQGSRNNSSSDNCGAAMFLPTTSFPQLVASGISDTGTASSGSLGGGVPSDLFATSSTSPTRAMTMASEVSGSGSNTSVI